PSLSGRWMGEIYAQREDVLPASLQVGAEAIDCLQVGVDRNHLGARVGGQIGVHAGIAAHVEDTRWLCGRQSVGDEAALSRVVLVAIVRSSLGVVRPR